MATLLQQQLGGGVAELIKPDIKGNVYVGMLKSRTSRTGSSTASAPRAGGRPRATARRTSART